MNKQNLTVQKFGKLTVIKRVENDKHYHKKWLCKCDCGNYKEVLQSCLLSGSTKSCGCLRLEINKTLKRNKKHGLSNTRLHKTWRGILDRITNPKNKQYSYYGGRGISICDEWKNDFKAFYDWAMSNGYADNLTIDRIDNNGNYEPSNCRWATYKIQNRNKNNIKKVEYKGKIYCASELAEKYNIKNFTFLNRLRKGWTIDKAINTKVKKR